MKQFTKKYQLWTSGDSAYTFTEFDTLQECIEAPKYSDWYVTKRVNLSVTDAEEQLTIPHVREIQPIAPRADEAREITDEERAEEELAAKYAGGPIGQLSESGLP